MCLRDERNEETQEVIEKLPDVFPVWKVMRRNDKNRTEFDVDGVHLLVNGINEARDHPAYRAPLEYKAGFHAFLRKEDASRYAKMGVGRVRKFWARKERIETYGYYTAGTLCAHAVVLMKISTRKIRGAKEE